MFSFCFKEARVGINDPEFIKFICLKISKNIISNDQSFDDVTLLNKRLGLGSLVRRRQQNEKGQRMNREKDQE